MKSLVKIYLGLIVLGVIGAILLFLVPTLLSAKSNEAVIGGFLIITMYVAVVLKVGFELFKKIPKKTVSNQ